MRATTNSPSSFPCGGGLSKQSSDGDLIVPTHEANNQACNLIQATYPGVYQRAGSFESCSDRCSVADGAGELTRYLIFSPAPLSNIDTDEYGDRGGMPSTPELPTAPVMEVAA